MTEATPSPSPTAFVMLSHGLDAVQYHASFERGAVPDPSPYSFHLAQEEGWRLIFSADRKDGLLTSLMRGMLRRLLGFDLLHAWTNRERLRAADVVWTMTENEWLAFRCLSWLVPAMRRPVIGNSVWLFNDWETKGGWHRWLVRRLAKGAGVLTVHSDRYLPLARVVFPTSRIERMYFGVQLDVDASPAMAGRARRAGEPLRVLAMGNDVTRDWDTFLAAFGNDSRFQIDLVCSWVSQEQRSRYGNLLPREPAASLSRAEMLRLYTWSDVVVVPMKENRFSGITSAIDACGHATPVISTRTGGVPTYFDEGEVLYVAPGDAAAMRESALLPDDQLATVARAGHARFLRSDYSSRGMIRRYIALSEEVLARD